MNRQRLTFAAFLLVCVYGLWYLQQQLTPNRPEVTPYAARPELLDDAPALVMAIETETDESTTSELAALRQTAQQRMEAASALEISPGNYGSRS